MDTLDRFGSGSELYTFDPSRQISLTDNFRELDLKINKIPGVSGGIYEYGTGPATRNVGVITTSFWLLADENIAPDAQAKQMQKLKDDLSVMTSFGVKRLYKNTSDPDLTIRYCDASVSNISYNEIASDQPHARLNVKVNFQTTSPYWFSQGTESPSWGDGSTWGTEFNWGGLATPYTVSGLSTSINLNVGGNSETFPRLVLSCGSSQTAENITIQRLFKNYVVDEVNYSGILSNNDKLIINTRSHAVTKNGLSHYTNDFSYLNPGWFRLNPGTNEIKVTMNNPTDSLNVEFRYFEAYT